MGYDIDDIANNFKNNFFDWEVIESSAEGIDVQTFCDDETVVLPEALEKAAARLKNIVPDESTDLASRFFNGARYCLTGYENFLKGLGEKNKCKLFFKKSDYRNFLVTNGLNDYWAKHADLQDQWKSPEEWYKQWEAQNNQSPFYFNSFGIYVLFTIKGSDHQKYAIFRERSDRVAQSKNTIVATVDEGLRRRSGDYLFDESSNTDTSPDLFKAAFRACKEETGIDAQQFPNHKLKLLSIGKIKSLLHYGALFHLDLDITIEEFEHACHISPDSRLEFGQSHLIKFQRDPILQFIRDSNNNVPISSYVIPLVTYALGVDAIKKKRVFLSHNSEDKPFARALAHRLKKQGFLVWIDEAEILFGESLITKISDAIFNDTNHLIAIISKKSVGSAWVKKELEWALTREINNRKLFVIPILIDKVDLPNYLQDKLYADLSEDEEDEAIYEKLYRTLRER